MIRRDLGSGAVSLGHRWMLLVLVLSCVSSSGAEAYFERVQAGARATAMGRAFGAIGNDASVLVYNPALLVTMSRNEAMAMYAKPYAIGNLQSNYVAVALPRDGFSLGAYWHHTGVQNVVGEDLIGISVARDLLEPGGAIAIAVGGTLKLASVGFTATELIDVGRQQKVTADLSALVNLSPTVTVSYTLANATAPKFEFIDGGGGTTLERVHDIGLGYFWHESSTVAAAFTKDAFGKWIPHAGAEIWFQQVFGLRVGAYEDEFSGGFGLKAKSYEIDLGFLTHSELGISYEVALRVPFGAPRW